MSDGPHVDAVRRPDEDRFVVESDGLLAELTYRLGDGRLELVHDGVPEPLAGQGIGGALVQAAVEWAASQGLTVVPTCPFARRWLREHPEVAARVSIDWHRA